MSTHNTCNGYPQHMFLLRNKKDISIFSDEKRPLSVAMLFLRGCVAVKYFFSYFSMKICYWYSLEAPQ